MTTPEELDALQSSSHAEIEALCKTVLDRWKLASEAYDKGYRNGVSASDADLRARVAELEAYGAADQRIATKTANDAATWKARAEAAEAELARLRQGVQVKPLTEATVERLRHDLQFIVDTIVKDKVEVSEAYPRLFAVLQQRRAEIGNLGGVQVFGEIARDLLQLMDGDHRAALVSPGDGPSEYEKKVAQMRRDFPNGI